MDLFVKYHLKLHIDITLAVPRISTHNLSTDVYVSV